MPSFDSLKNAQNHLIRKALTGIVAVGPSTVAAPVSLTGADMALLALPAGMEDVGLLTDDGAQFGRDVETSEVTSWGEVEPSRVDITSDRTTLQFQMQETKKATLEMYIGADLSAVTPDPTSGEVSIESPERPAVRHYRVLSIGKDDSDAGEIYIARFLPRARVTDYEEQTFQSSDDSPLTYGITVTGFKDAALGYSQRWMFGGPGWNALLADMSF